MSVAKRRILRWQTGGKPLRHNDAIAIEEPLEIRIDTHSIAVTMRTPGHDPELAAGFLLSEGIIATRSDITKIGPDTRNSKGNVINVFLAPGVTLDLALLTRHVFASSSCGLCGKASIEAVHRHFKPIVAPWRVKRAVLASLPDQLRSAQEVFSYTGGLHAAAIFDAHGQAVVVREDVGRHNAVDKVLGFGLLKGEWPYARHILMVSGRVSFEIVQKALAGRLAIIAAVSAPSSLAVDFARQNNQTLVGFLRGDRMNIYSAASRVCG